MKNVVLLAALAGLAGCSGSDADAEAPVASGQIDEPVPANVAADGNPSAGSFRAVDQNGVVLMEELRPDGTYAFSDEAGALLETGQWKQKSPEELCFTAGFEGAAETCYEEEITDDGTWVSTNPLTGETATIERLDAGPSKP